MKTDERLVFAVSRNNEITTIIIGISEDAWKYMKDGDTHLLDLSSIGVKAQFILYGAKDRATALAFIKDFLDANQTPYTDLSSDVDRFTIKDKNSKSD